MTATREPAPDVPRRAYVDASALVKLAVRERESAALRADVTQRPTLVTSRLGLVEAERAVRRVDLPPLVELRAVFQTVDVIEISPALMAQAAAIAPATLRTLDAIHLATLRLLGAADLDVITYDDRLAEAARQHGFVVVRPTEARPPGADPPQPLE